MRKFFSNQQLALLGVVFLALAASAFFMVNVELPNWSHWLSGANVILFAVPAFWATRRWVGWRDAFVLWALLGVYAILIETSAIYTGFPYGHFGYSELLGAKLFGTTPWTVCLAWTPLLLGAYAVAAQFFSNAVLRILATAVVATAFDLVLDPGAVRLGFWQYADGGMWYGVPWSNFGGWILSAGVGACLVEGTRAIQRPRMQTPVQLASSAILILYFWTMIAVFARFSVVALVGLALLAFLRWVWIKFGFRFDEMLVLCDESGRPVATMRKEIVHTSDTPRHLAFSIFLFNSKGELLLQQRALSKKTWPGVWSNSCCGHVMLHERTVNAAKRRLKYELGIGGANLKVVLPDFRYRAEKDGVVENEICPVFVGTTDKLPRPNPDEVGAIRWVKWEEFLTDVRKPDTEVSPWAVEEVELLAASSEFNKLRV